MNTRADWLLKFRISFAIHLRAIRAEFAPTNVVIFAGINELKSYVCAILSHYINPKTIAAFRSTLETIDWSLIYNSDSTNDSYDTFSSLLMSAYHKSCPLKPLYPECRRPSKLWFLKGLFVSCNRKTFLYKQFQTNPTESNKSRYNKYRNKYNFPFLFAIKKKFMIN